MLLIKGLSQIVTCHSKSIFPLSNMKQKRHKTCKCCKITFSNLNPTIPNIISIQILRQALNPLQTSHTNKQTGLKKYTEPKDLDVQSVLSLHFLINFCGKRGSSVNQ